MTAFVAVVSNRIGIVLRGPVRIETRFESGPAGAVVAVQLGLGSGTTYSLRRFPVGGKITLLNRGMGAVVA